jgi:hypothetical protein
VEEALGHLDGHEGRGGQDHRSIRMIEKPFPVIRAFLSGENLLEAKRRIRYRSWDHPNPNNLLTVTREQYRSYLKFTFVRNPWARVYSWYRNVMRDDHHRKNYGITGTLPLAEFLRLHIGKGMIRPQTSWIRSFDGTISMDFIGRYENLAGDFEKVCGLLELDGITLPHKIKGSGSDYREDYDERSRRMVHRAYREEIEMFDYSFET